MGCVSSKLFRKELRQEIIISNGGREHSVHHVVSLTSTTYGALKLDAGEQQQKQQQRELEQEQEQKPPVKQIVAAESKQRESPTREEEAPAEVINAWELMGDLEEDGVPGSCSQQQTKRSPKSRVLLRGFADVDARSPLKFLNQIGSPRKAKTFGGKENKLKRSSSDFSPRPVFKANNSPANSCKAVMRLSYPVKSSPNTERLSNDSAVASRRRSFGPLFDPELVASYERELSQEKEQIKRVISPTPRSQKLKLSREMEAMLRSFEQICPPRGENAVVIYTTTLRGIRKTYEDCNAVRSIIESHHVQMLERDISMDSGFKEELRTLMGAKQVRVPLVFVKGRLIGGADQVLKLEEEGKLGMLFDGIPRRVAGGCKGCAGFRFVMCVECNGSCKVLDKSQKMMVKCGDCNENGLIQCRICC